MRREGELLEKQQNLNVARLFKARHQVKLVGQEGLAVNAPGLFSSDLGHLLAEKSGSFGLLIFIMESDNAMNVGYAQ